MVGLSWLYTGRPVECKLTGCGGPEYAAGLCSKHYNRLRTTGTTDPGPRARASVAERFWRSVDRRGPDECWLFTQKLGPDGYGRINVGGRGVPKKLAHRVSWELHNGLIPDGEGPHGTVVMHTCDNRRCVNPAHLRLGAQGENVADMDQKGRRVSRNLRGPAHGNAVLTEADVRFIRRSKANNAELGRRFGVYRSTIRDIRRRRTWTHV